MKNKTFDEACKALEATPKGKAFEGACKAKEKAWDVYWESR